MSEKAEERKGEEGYELEGRKKKSKRFMSEREEEGGGVIDNIKGRGADENRSRGGGVRKKQLSPPFFQETKEAA